MLKLKLATVVTTGVLASLVGCSAKITSSACEYNGESYNLGETFPAADGCNTCSCDEEGVACTEMGCSSCEGPEPDCGAPPPGCTIDTVCTGAGDWSCELRCDCAEAPPIDCQAPPPGCFYDGPVCVDGNWSCGDLICSGSCQGPEPECPQPGAPGCFSYATCTEFGWECLTQCDPCAAKPPVCPQVGSALAAAASQAVSVSTQLGMSCWCKRSSPSVAASIKRLARVSVLEQRHVRASTQKAFAQSAFKIRRATVELAWRTRPSARSAKATWAARVMSIAS
jgi:hypothetical protein